MSFFKIFTLGLVPTVKKIVSPLEELYSVTINSLDGQPITLLDFKGKKILFVNVASKCGLTPQYKELEALHQQYKDKLVIIGVPCNQFGEQEPGSATEIQAFCERNYRVSFLITEKVDVKGENQHPLYQWLTQKEKNGSTYSEVKWNFQKYLINERGQLESIFAPTKKPLNKTIINHLS